MSKLRIVLGVAVLLLFVSQNAAAWWWVDTDQENCNTQCNFPDGCYYVDFCGNYIIEDCSCYPEPSHNKWRTYLNQNDCNQEIAKLCLKLKINYDDGKTTLVSWQDMGSDPAVTLDTEKTNAKIKAYVHNQECKTYLEIDPVFMANNNEYHPGYVKLHIDTSDFTITSMEEEGFIFSSLSAEMSQTPCGGEIPEFPTIALPMAAIIGLAFIFQNRKEN
jgi:hypothetical protein